MAEQFGPYRLEHLIGRGGMGEVHRAYDTARGRTVALKRLPAALADDPEFQARFRRESALAAQLSEPHIIPIHDFGAIDGRLYIDMRLVEGVDLGTVVAAQGAMPPRRVITILAQVAAALDAAHAAGLVHRDVKPSNILVRGSGEDEFAYLIDFGIARATAGPVNGPAVTQTGATIGTLDYMAPERFENVGADGRADVYSLACVLFELLTGRPPYHGKPPLALMHAHIALDAPRPSAHRPGLPPGLDAVVQRGMAKNPNHRYPTAGSLIAAARAALRAPTPQPQPTPPPQPPPPVFPPPLRSGPTGHRPIGLTAPPRPVPRPGGVVVAFILQLLSGGLFLLGCFLFLIGVLTGSSSTGISPSEVGISVTVSVVLMLVSLLYIVGACLAFAGRNWARMTVAVINGVFALFMVIVLVAAVVDSSSDSSTALGAFVIFVATAGVLVGCTLPMFTRPAREYFTAAR